jgi:hypothetical protein
MMLPDTGMAITASSIRCILVPERVRQVIVYNIASKDAIYMFATVALLAVLIAGIVLVKSEMPCPPEHYFGPK